MKQSDEIFDVIERNHKWLKENNWAGYDPYDIRSTKIFISLKRVIDKKLPCHGRAKASIATEENKTCKYHTSISPLIRKGLKNILFATENSMPVILRKISLVRKSVIPKGMGLFADAYIEIYKKTKDSQYLTAAIYCLNWLKKNSIPGWSGICWGLPFDWQSKIFIPRYTPCAVVTTICGKAFWNFYNLTRDEEALLICREICNFLVNDLRIDHFSKEKSCFSYTPIDNFHIHNANLLVAEFLLEIGMFDKSQSLIELAQRALNYSVSQQKSNGAFLYWGFPDSKEISNNSIDNFHTGFVLRSLYSIFVQLPDDNLRRVIKKGYDFYINNFFDGNVLPKKSIESTYPIDIHNCAEAILCISLLKNEFGPKKNILGNILNWTIDNMFDEKGYFYFLKTPHRTIKVPYIRWGQAWMLNALSRTI